MPPWAPLWLHYDSVGHPEFFKQLKVNHLPVPRQYGASAVV